MGPKVLGDPLVSQLLGASLASSPWVRAQWYEAAKVAELPLNRNKAKKAVKQCASSLFVAPQLIRLFIDLNVPKRGFRHMADTSYAPRWNGPPTPVAHSLVGLLHRKYGSTWPSPFS